MVDYQKKPNESDADYNKRVGKERYNEGQKQNKRIEDKRIVDEKKIVDDKTIEDKRLYDKRIEEENK